MGGELDADEIELMARGIASGEIPDYQIAAWAMAVFLRGMSERETTTLTLAMARSGEVLDLSSIAPIVADKHSSGGVGDKTTLVVAPWVAACGVPVGKMSGRGLSFGGGTVDKLEAIPGYRIDLNAAEFKAQLQKVGIVVSGNASSRETRGGSDSSWGRDDALGQTHDLAPADGKLYALREVTATVDCVPLIASSIMSKKIAAGANAIVLDVKAGRGAFMKTEADAVALAGLMVGIGRGSGRRVAAVIGDMSQPLGYAIGNSLEVIEAIETLKGNGPADLYEHCLTVGSQMLLLSGAAENETEARQTLERVLRQGTAFSKFIEWIRTQGGDEQVAFDYARLPRAAQLADVRAAREGFITGIDPLELGLTCVLLGGGREFKGQAIDYAVGLVVHKKVGDAVRAGDGLVTIHANDPAKLEQAVARARAAFSLGDAPVAPPPLIHRIIN